MSNEGNTFENKYVKIKRDLNFKSNYSYSDKDNTELFGDYNGDGVVEGIKEELVKDGANGFVPINEFSGTLLGENKSIKNVLINREMDINTRKIGLINVNSGTVQDLNLTGTININVKAGNNIAFRIGGVCGDNEGKVINATNEIQITANCESGTAWFYIGGVAGNNQGKSTTERTASIENCTNLANISATGTADCRIAGVVGRVYYAIINNCKNSGYIKADSSDYACTGGVASDANYSEIDKSCNTGKLEAIGKSRVYTGGIASMDSDLTLKNSYNTGETIINGYAARSGGITGGSAEGTTIENCYNVGTIRATSNSTVIRVGGIVGFAFYDSNKPTVSIRNSYNAGKMDIQGQADQKGSLYGNFFGTIENCYAIPQTDMGLGGNTSDKITITDSDIKSLEDMKKEEFVTLLNKNGNAYKFDKNNVNNGLPILNY